MGNKLCKKKSDALDNPKSPTPFDRIINRLNLRPNAWKSDSHLNQKQVNRLKVNPDDPNGQTKLLSKSSDWTDVGLEVPEKDDGINLKNPKLSLIFDNNTNTPTPPPRKHKKGIREKIEAVAKNSLQAIQGKKPVDEPLFIKKVVKPTCPTDEHDCAIHNRNHKHDSKKKELTDSQKEERLRNVEDEVKTTNKDVKRKKNLSVVSLPNYSDLKLTVANFDDIDKKTNSSDKNSVGSLQSDSKKLTSGKLESYMPRCRSFGSLFPQQLLGKLKPRKVAIDIDSDDSFGGLEDWDLRILEHYNPKDTSLPRPRKLPKNNVLSNIESLVVKEEETEKPTPPTRRSESLVKKINKKTTESQKSVTPPPSPKSDEEVKPEIAVSAAELPTEENGKVEHSTLMKILEEFSINEKKREQAQKHVKTEETNPLIASRIQLQKNIVSIEDFLKNEKQNTGLPHNTLSNVEVATT